MHHLRLETLFMHSALNPHPSSFMGDLQKEKLDPASAASAAQPSLIEVSCFGALYL